MGINQLLKALKTIVKPRKISDYANMRVAVDTYCWLHKGIYSCASEIIEEGKIDKLITYCVRKVEMLLKHKIKVVMVFDGGKLPMKQETEESRQKRRAINLEKGHQYMRDGDRDKATQSFAASIDVTTDMANALIKVLQEKNIECIVAPFEADAQLAYLSRTGYVDVIITEDSDLLAFGANRIFYKMDQVGDGQEICLEELPLCTDYSFTNWTNNMFLTLCIMAGCDYVDSIPQVGIKTAYIQIHRLKNYKLVISHFMQSGKYNVPIDYLQNFEQAFLTFRYTKFFQNKRFQTVFDPISRRALSLNSIDRVRKDISYEIVEPCLIQTLENVDTDFSFLGELYDDQIICRIADGHICPISFQPHYVKQQSLSIQNVPINGMIYQQNLESQQMPIQQQTQTPVYGQKTNKQIFNLARPINYKSSEQKNETKQTTINSYFKSKSESSQELVSQLLAESLQGQSTQNKKTIKMKPFKTPAQVPKQLNQEDLQGTDPTKTEQQEKEYQKSTKIIDQSHEFLQESLQSLDYEPLVMSQSSSIQRPYQYDDVIMRGIDDKPVVLTREILNRKLEYNNFGEYMAEKITFKPEFNFNF